MSIVCVCYVVCANVMMYDVDVCVYVYSGKLVQIEYALQAVAAGKTSLGIKGIQQVLHIHTCVYVDRYC